METPNEANQVRSVLDARNEDDICGLCGEPGADKYPHPEHWPGEQIPNETFVHAECEQAECKRAFDDYQRRVGENGVREFLRRIERD
jgi:hypothetical protein